MPPVTVHTPDELLVTDVVPSPVVETVGTKLWPGAAFEGRLEIVGAVGVARVMVNVCCAWGAGAHDALPP